MKIPGRIDRDGRAAITFDGTHIWVANTSGNSVTELKASDGSFIRTFTGAGSRGRPNWAI